MYLKTYLNFKLTKPKTIGDEVEFLSNGDIRFIIRQDTEKECIKRFKILKNRYKHIAQAIKLLVESKCLNRLIIKPQEAKLKLQIEYEGQDTSKAIGFFSILKRLGINVTFIQISDGYTRVQAVYYFQG